MRILALSYCLLASVLTVACSKLDVSQQMRVRITDESALAGSQLDNGLPVIFVRTSDGKGVTRKTESKAAKASIFECDGTMLLPVSAARVKGRGHASWNFPKKPFNLTLEAPADLLGTGAATRWCALANWRDITLMRNDIALQIARMTSLEWTPSGEFTELVMDGIWQGNFYITEKVEPLSGRLNIGPGGFLVCIDSYYSDTFRFKTKIRSLPVGIKMPDGRAMDEEAFEGVRDCMDRAEAALYRGQGDWQELLDAQSFCDWLIVHELTGNNEPTRPHSVYMYKRADGKITAGPCWDFDCRTFTPGRKGLLNRSAVWFDALLSQEAFRTLLKERWTALRPLFAAEVPAYIEDTWERIERSAELNHKMWPISTVLSNTNGDEKLSPAEAVDRMQAALAERLQELDKTISEL